MKKEIIKMVGNVVIGGSVGTFIGHVGVAVLPPQIKATQKVLTVIGSCIIAQYVSNKITKDFEETIDEIFDGSEVKVEPETV